MKKRLETEVLVNKVKDEVKKWLYDYADILNIKYSDSSESFDQEIIPLLKVSLSRIEDGRKERLTYNINDTSVIYIFIYIMTVLILYVVQVRLNQRFI